MQKRLLKKCKKTTPKIDITKAFHVLSKRTQLYMVTLTGIPVTHVKDLNFQLTNNFFNTIHREVKATNEELSYRFFGKDYSKNLEYIDYLFVIEYGSLITKDNIDKTFIRNFGIHAHCIINTSLSEEQLKVYADTCFKKKTNCEIENITKSNTKAELLNYLLKQDKKGFITSENYNYKISI